VYVVTWILLGQNSEETVDESAQKQFTVRAHSFLIGMRSKRGVGGGWGLEARSEGDGRERTPPISSYRASSFPLSLPFERLRCHAGQNTNLQYDRFFVYFLLYICLASFLAGVFKFQNLTAIEVVAQTQITGLTKY